MINLPTIHTFWIGDTLGPVSRACLSSFITVGHRVILHCYQSPADIPAGVETGDAEQIVPRSLVRPHKQTGSYAAFSDFFRFKLLSLCDGIYADCDIFCLKALETDDFLVGFEADNTINGALLALPKDSPLLHDLIGMFDPDCIPVWLPVRKQRKLRWKKRFGWPVDYTEMPWGTYGPSALTYFIRKAGLLEKVQPRDVFYPVDYRHIDSLFDPDLTISDITTSRTLCIHLYNERLRRRMGQPVPSSSPLGRLLNSNV